jgi:putative transposase
METVRIYQLKDLGRGTRARLKAAQMEAARVWMYCVGRHRAARAERTGWPDRDDLQQETKGGQYALYSQSIQMVCHQFLANVETINQVRPSHPRHRYPYRPKKYMTVQWPAQAVCRQGKRLILPMGRGRKSFSFHLPDLPEQIGAVSLVWKGGYELHVVVPAAFPAPVLTPSDKTIGQLARLQARCQKGSKRWRRLQYTKERASGKSKRRVRDLRHKGTRQVVDFCQRERVQTLYVGDPHGVRRENKGHHHNQRMSQWEYGKDKQYLHEKCAQVGIACFSGSERGTSSHCPRCDWKKKPRGRNWTCRRCGFSGHRDIVGSMNMHPLAFGSRISYPTSLTYRRPGPLRDRRQNKELPPGGAS